MIKKSLPCFFTIMLFISILGCSQSTKENDTNTIIKAGQFYGSGWGTVELNKNQDKYTGTYTDTWTSDKGKIELWYDNNKWQGYWEEPAIKRGGKLYNIAITNNGNNITGLYNVTRSGEKISFEDKPFSWKAVP